MARKTEWRVAAIDFETDPFQGRDNEVYPFAAGFYDGDSFHLFWGSDCPSSLCGFIRDLKEPHILYAHNGGKFDFNYMLDWIDPDVFCIGARVVRAYIVSPHAPIGKTGKPKWRHQLRDSLAAIPVPLPKRSNNRSFDYRRMLEQNRDRHRLEITTYLKDDCADLLQYMLPWRATFGPGLTMAAAAMDKLDKEMQPFLGRSKAAVKMGEKQDEFFRRFYYGGRVQCFEQGVIRPRSGSLILVDINSSYPNVMRNVKHPIGSSYRVSEQLTADTDFAVIDASSNGALPILCESPKRLEFPHGRFVFHATGHEIRAGLELGLLKVHRVVEAWECSERTSFAPFIDTFWKARKIAQANGHEVYSLFHKLVMNGAYGKFAQNPRRFKDYRLCKLNDERPEPLCETPGCDETCGNWHHSKRETRLDVYCRLSSYARSGAVANGFVNVATGASITGAARAAFLRGLHQAVRPVYGDTDSIICESFTGPVGSDLGQWKIEKRGAWAAVAGKKLYALFDEAGSCVKIASKGVRLTPDDMIRAAEGITVHWTNEAPSFRRDGQQYWITRTIKRLPWTSPDWIDLDEAAD